MKPSSYREEEQTTKQLEREKIAQELFERWNRPFVGRDEIKDATGVELSRKTLANYDSLGTGPGGKVSFGRKVVYRSEEFFRWFASRIL